MNNSDRQYRRKDSELPLSKRLTQEFICSPMLRRNGQPAKETKKFGKNPDVNLLFDDEKPKAKTRRTEKLRRVIDLSDAIRKQIVRIDDKKLTSGDRAQKILKKRAPKWTEKLNPTTMSYFVEVDTKTPSSAGTGISTGSKSENSRTLEVDAGSTLANSNNPEINNRIPDARIPDGSIVSNIGNLANSEKHPEESIVSAMDNSRIQADGTRTTEGSILSNMSKAKVGSTAHPETSIVSAMDNSKFQVSATRIPEGSVMSNKDISKIQAGSARIPEGSIGSNKAKIQAVSTKIPESSVVSNIGYSKGQTGSTRLPEGSITSNMSKIQASNTKLSESSRLSNASKIKEGTKLPKENIQSEIGISKIQAGISRIAEISVSSNESKTEAGSTKLPEAIVSNKGISNSQAGGTRISEGSTKLQSNSMKIPGGSITSIMSGIPRIPAGSILSRKDSSRIPKMSREYSSTTISLSIRTEDIEVDTKSDLTTLESHELKSASFENLRKKMSSHSRLEGSELHHLHEKAAERKFSKMSTGSNSKTMGQPGLHLRRQLSEIDLNLLDENERDQSMEPHLDISKDDKRTACLYPGWEVGQHCHSVAASVLNRGWPEPCISSSSSSDDLFESTKYSREIIEEKLRGLELEKKQEGERSKEVKEKKRKGKLKHKRGSKCNCKNKKHHTKCSHPVLPKANVSEESLHESEVSKSPSTLMVSSKDNVNPSPSQLIQVPQDTKEKLGSTANLVDDQSDKSSSSEEILKRSCNRDTCPSLNKGLPEEIDDSESQRITSCETMKKPKDDEKLKSEVVKEPTPSSLRLKTGISDAGSSASTIRPEYCTQETCDFSKNQTQIRNAELHKQFEISKSEHSHKTTIKKEICSPKTCKMSGCRYKKLFSSKAKKSKARIKIGRLRRRIQLQRKHHNFICDCQNVYVDNQDSDSDDLWSDKELKRSRNRRYCLNLEHLKTRALRKCGGYMTEGHRCNCYTCYIKEKPWKDFLKKPNALLDVPYPLTTKALKLRAQNTNTLSKKLRNKYNWSEENLKNFCTRHEVCKKPNLRKSLLRENPFTWEWKWCQKDAVEKKVKKKEVPKEDNPGRFGYFVKIKEERLTRGEHFTNVQKIIEKAVFCKWNLDSAEMKLNHFLENMPKQQTCYYEGKTFDSDRRTCYNPKLIERLSDMTNFNEEPDRKIHEFSFPPKLLKYQEPQLVGDIGTDMPEIKPVLEVAKFPTLYRDLFKDQKRDLRKLVDAIFPPLQWTDKAGLWEMKVSIKPDNGDTNIALLKYLDFNETLCHAINKNFCAGRYRLYFELFAEMIRQEMIDYPERAFLLARIREEFLLTLLLYDGGLEMTLVGTTHLWKGIEEDTIDIMEKTVLEEEIEDLKLQIKGVTIATYDLEKRVEEQSQTRDYQFKDQEKLYKRTNHQLAAQFENITAGLLYDLD